ncbi:MAG: M1 family metallopeptidase [Planctomycetota bacterium]|nr:M1 family metallopeptidase [Planctomycetota bacterium]
MKKIYRALLSALPATLHCWRPILLVWLFTTVIATLIASPIEGAIEDAFSKNPLSKTLLTAFDNEVFVDFHNVHDTAVDATATAARTSSLPWILVWTILSAGFLSRIVDRRNPRSFFSSCALFAHRFLWLLIITGVALTGLSWLNDHATNFVVKILVDGDAPGVAALGWGMTLKTITMLVLLGLLLHTQRLARLRMILLGERFAPLSWLRALAMLIRRFPTATAGYTLALLPLILVWIAYAMATEELFTEGHWLGLSADWRYALVAHGTQLLLTAALVYRIAAEARLWPVLSESPPRPGKPAPVMAHTPPAQPPEAEDGDSELQAVSTKPVYQLAGVTVLLGTLLFSGSLWEEILSPTPPPPPVMHASSHADFTSRPLPDAPVRQGEYRIEAKLDVENATVVAKEWATFINTSTQPVEDLWLHLYAAAFANSETTWMTEGSPEPIKDRGAEDGGFLSMRSVGRVPGPAKPVVDLKEVTTINDSLMHVDLRHPVLPGDSVTLLIEFETRFPRVIARMGKTGKHIDGMQWYPKYCAHSEKGWNNIPFHRMGEFFADFAHYEVTFEHDEEVILEATGIPTELETDIPGIKRVRYITPSDVHDFAFCADPDFVRATKTFTYPNGRDVEIIYLCQPYATPKIDQVLDIVASCLDFAGRYWMPFPYPRIVVDGLPHSLGGGMEYPMLFTISQRFPNHWQWLVDLTEDPAGVTAHEFGHEYWYGIMANNEYEEAWLDEGINSWGTTKFLEYHWKDRGRTDLLTFLERDLMVSVANGSFTTHIPWLDDRLGLQDCIGWNQSPFHDTPPEDPTQNPSLLGFRFPSIRSLRLPDMSAGRAVWQKGRYYNVARHLPLSAPSRDHERGTYGPLVYSKAALVMESLERHLGFERMQQVMSAYVFRHAFTHPTRDDFLSVVSSQTGGVHDRWLSQLITTKGALDFSVESVVSRKERGLLGYSPQTHPGDPVTWVEPDKEKDTTLWFSRFVVRQLGEIEAPVEIEMVFEDGTTLRKSWNGTGAFQRIEHRGPSRLTEVTVDPDRRFLIDLNRNNNGWRRKEAKETTSVLTTFVRFWAQTYLNGWAFLF